MDQNNSAGLLRQQGWLFKRIPRITDTDKKSLKRSALGVTSMFKSKFQLRWFDLQPEHGRLAYFKSKPTSTTMPAGTISLQTVISITKDRPLDEVAPTQYLLNIHTADRIFTLAAETEVDRDQWVDTLTTVCSTEEITTAFRSHRAAVMDVVDLHYEKRVVPKSQSSRQLILEGMRTNVLFRNCHTQEIVDLIDAFESIEVKTGTLVIKQGERGDDFFIVERGAVEVYLNQPSGEPLKFGEALVCGASFGELALMYNTPRAATIQVCEDALLWKIDRTTVRSTIAHFQMLRVQQYSEFLSVVQFEGRQLGDVLNLDQLHRLAMSLESEEFAAGHVIIREGEPGDFFYILEEGVVDVYKSSCPDQVGLVTPEAIVASLQVGQYFGEKALLSRDLRAATCVAASHGCRCLKLKREEFTMILGPLSDLLDGKGQRHSMFGLNEAQVEEEEEFDICELETIKTLGFGAFGVVRMVQHKVSKKGYALKCLSKAGILQYKLQEHTLRERRLLKRLNHPFVLKLHGAMKDDRFIYFVLELLLGGELFTHLERKGCLLEEEAMFYAAQVQQAFDHIHKFKIAYRDLKPENLVLDTKGYVTVVDFGLAKQVEGKTFTVCGTPDYLAPEIILNEGHDKAVDYWALGVFIFELVFTDPPFSGEDPMNTYKNIVDRNFTIPSTSSPDLGALIRQLLRPQSKRLGNGKEGCRAIAQHPWFSGIDFAALLQKTISPPIPITVSNPLDSSNFDDYDEEEEGFSLPPVVTSWDPDLSI